MSAARTDGPATGERVPAHAWRVLAISAAGVFVVFLDATVGYAVGDGSLVLRTNDGGATWAEQHVTGPFDMKLAPNARGFFLGDYMGLEAIGDDLLAFFATTQGDSANVYSVRANR